MTQLETRLKKLEAMIKPTEHFDPVTIEDAINTYCSMRILDVENVALIQHVEDGHTHRPELMPPTSILRHLRAVLLESGIDPESEYSDRTGRVRIQEGG
jgi:hypothetical protein